MSGKLGPTAQQRLAILQGFTPLVGRINNLTEQFATARTGQDQFKASLKRAAGQTKIRLMAEGLDELAQICGSIELAASRPGHPAHQARTLRELVGSLKFQLDFAMRIIVRDDQDAQARKRQDDGEPTRETDV